MTNFKSGSGNLDFGGGSTDADEDGSGGQTERNGGRTDDDPPRDGRDSDRPAASADGAASSSPFASDEEDGLSPERKTDAEEGSAESEDEEIDSTPTADEYPYFVRRNNVGDERDTRLEIHIRDEVADREAAFRNELAERLGANEVSKTDAREFALLAAYEHPERVAELMEEEGFGALD